MIDLTSIKPQYYEEIIKIREKQSREELVEQLGHEVFINQNDVIDNIIDEQFNISIKGFVEDVLVFINESTSSDDGNSFPRAFSNTIHPAHVVLGVRTGDHSATIDAIVTQIQLLKRKIFILRMTPNLVKRNELIKLLEPAKQAKQILVIVERTEIMDKSCLRVLMAHLKRLLEAKLDRRIMILLCTSSCSRTIETMVPNCLDFMMKPTLIVKEPIDDVAVRMERELLENQELSFKIGPHLIELIFYNFVRFNASFTYLREALKILANIYSHRKATLLTQPRKTLKKLFKTCPKFICELKDLKSIMSLKESIAWHNPSELATFCHDSIESLKSYDHFMRRQVNAYFLILRDKTNLYFPGRLNEVYAELFNHDHLGQSVHFTEAVQNLRNLSPKALLQRIIPIVSETYFSEVPSYGEIKSVSEIIVKYYERLENNDCPKGIVKELVADLHNHSESMLNILRLPLSEAIFLDEADQFQQKFLCYSREYIMEPMGPSPRSYDILFNLIASSPEDINMSNLFDEFALGMNAEMKSTKCLKSDLKNDTTILTQQRRKRQSTRNANLSKTNVVRQQDNPPKDGIDEGLLKARFEDLIACMELEGIIKEDTSKLRAGILRRTAWL